MPTLPYEPTRSHTRSYTPANNRLDTKHRDGEPKGRNKILSGSRERPLCSALLQEANCSSYRGTVNGMHINIVTVEDSNDREQCTILLLYALHIEISKFGKQWGAGPARILRISSDTQVIGFNKHPIFVLRAHSVRNSFVPSEEPFSTTKIL